MKGLASTAPFINALTINFATLHILLMFYMAMTLVAMFLFFRDNTLMTYAIIVMDAVVWVIAVYSILYRIYTFPKDTLVAIKHATSLIGQLH